MKLCTQSKTRRSISFTACRVSRTRYSAAMNPHLPAYLLAQIFAAHFLARRPPFHIFARGVLLIRPLDCGNRLLVERIKGRFHLFHRRLNCRLGRVESSGSNLIVNKLARMDRSQGALSPDQEAKFVAPVCPTDPLQAAFFGAMRCSSSSGTAEPGAGRSRTPTDSRMLNAKRRSVRTGTGEGVESGVFDARILAPWAHRSFCGVGSFPLGLKAGLWPFRRFFLFHQLVQSENGVGNL
jgi:hypothetical protein